MVTIKVTTLEYKKTIFPNGLDSGGVGPCTVIGAIYENRGYMIHYVMVDANIINTKLDQFFQDLRTDAEDKNRVGLYVIGAAIDGDEEIGERAKILARRQNLLRRIQLEGFTPYEVRWCPADHTQNLLLNLREGNAKITMRKY